MISKRKSRLMQIIGWIILSGSVGLIAKHEWQVVFGMVGIVGSVQGLWWNGNIEGMRFANEQLDRIEEALGEHTKTI